MNKRIRYVPDGSGCMISKRIIETHHGEIVVKFNPDNHVVQFFTASEPPKLVSSFTYGSNHQLKIQIKKELLAMGAVFEEEKRIRNEKSID